MEKVDFGTAALVAHALDHDDGGIGQSAGMPRSTRRQTGSLPPASLPATKRPSSPDDAFDRTRGSRRSIRSGREVPRAGKRSSPPNRSPSGGPCSNRSPVGSARSRPDSPSPARDRPGHSGVSLTAGAGLSGGGEAASATVRKRETTFACEVSSLTSPESFTSPLSRPLSALSTARLYLTRPPCAIELPFVVDSGDLRSGPSPRVANPAASRCPRILFVVDRGHGVSRSGGRARRPSGGSCAIRACAARAG